MHAPSIIDRSELLRWRMDAQRLPGEAECGEFAKACADGLDNSRLHDVCAAVCSIVDHVIGVGLSLFESLKANADAIKSAPGTRAEKRREIAKWFREWVVPCPWVMKAVELLERHGFRVNNAQRLLTAWDAAIVYGVGPDEYNSALEAAGLSRHDAR